MRSQLPVKLYRAMLADGRWLYPLARTDQRAFEGAEYWNIAPGLPPVLLAEPDAQITVLAPGRLELIGWRRVSIAKLYAGLPEYIAVADWEAAIGEPASVDGVWHDLIRNGLYVEARDGQPERVPFDTSVYTDAPFDLTEPPEPDPDPDWQFQPSIAYSVFGPVYARLLPGVVLGCQQRLADALALLEGVSGVEVERDRVVGVLTLPFEDNRRITAREGRRRRQRLATNKIPFRIPFADHAAGDSKADAVDKAQQAIAAAVASLPVEMVCCARCDGLGVVPSFQTPTQRRLDPHPVLAP